MEICTLVVLSPLMGNPSFESLGPDIQFHSCDHDFLLEEEEVVVVVAAAAVVAAGRLLVSCLFDILS